MSHIKKLITSIVKKNIFMYSAQVAFYFLLSLFPFIYITTKLLSLFSLSVVNFLDSLRYVFPSMTYDIIYNTFLTTTVDSTTPHTILYVLIALWSSSMLFNSLKITFVESYAKKNENNPIVTRVISIGITIIVLFVIVFSIFATLIVNIGISFVSRYIDITYFSHILTTLATITITIADMVVLYMVLPPKRLKITEAVPGAIFSTVGLSFSSILFSYYISQIADYSKFYGTMGSVIVLLLWLYVCSFVIISGGYVNAYFIKIKAKSHT